MSGAAPDATPDHLGMDRVIAHTNDGATLHSVLTLAGVDVRHRYRIVGGAHDGAEFATLCELATFAAGRGIQLTTDD
jgi:hypothetical protein